MKKILLIGMMLSLCGNAYGAVELDGDANGGVDISKGGTDATTASAARVNLGVPPSGTLDNQIAQWNSTLSAWETVSTIAGLINDDAGNGDTNALWSADKAYDMIMANKGASTIGALSDWPVNVSATELGFVDGATSNLQAQIAAISVGVPVTTVPSYKDTPCTKGQYAYSADGLTMYQCVATNDWRTLTLSDSLSAIPSTWTLTVTDPGNGNKITCTDVDLVTPIDCGDGGVACSSTVADNASVTGLTAVPDVAYAFTNWAGDLQGAENPTATALVMNANKDIDSNFSIINADCTNLGTWSLYYDADHSLGQNKACISGSTVDVTPTAGVTYDATANSTIGGTYGVKWDGAVNHYLNVPAVGITPANGRIEFDMKIPIDAPAQFAILEWWFDATNNIKLRSQSAGGVSTISVYHTDSSPDFVQSSSQALVAGSVYHMMIDWNSTSGQIRYQFGNLSGISAGQTVSSFTTPANGVRFFEDQSGYVGIADIGIDNIKMGASQQ